MDETSIFYKKTLNVFLAIENKCKVKDIYSKANTTLYYIFVILKKFIELKIIYKKKHRYFLTDKGLKLRDKLLKIRDLLKKE